MPLVRNPILPGFNADPSIVRVADDGNKSSLQTPSRYRLTICSEYDISTFHFKLNGLRFAGHPCFPCNAIRPAQAGA